MSALPQSGLIDRTIPYLPVLMVRDPAPLPECPLPAGYRLAFYQPGDREHWIDLHLAVDQFRERKEAGDCFDREFVPAEELTRRMLFVFAPDGSCAGTSTAWFEKTGEGRVHWVAVHPDHRGKGIAKALVCRTVEQLDRLHGGRITLHSGTWNHVAVHMYGKLGFVPQYGEKSTEEAWRLIREANGGR